MSIYEKLSNNKQDVDPMKARRELMSNPSAFLKKCNLNVPDNITDPQQMVMYLVQSGQFNPAKYPQTRGLFGRR